MGDPVHRVCCGDATAERYNTHLFSSVLFQCFVHKTLTGCYPLNASEMLSSVELERKHTGACRPLATGRVHSLDVWKAPAHSWV